MGFARREEHERAFKVTSACGFEGIELNAGTGRWDPLGRPENIDINYGSARGFLRQLNDWGIESVASTFYDPGQMSFEDLHHGLLPTRRDDHAIIQRTAAIHAQFLAEVGAACLVVRPFPSYWKEGSLNAERMQIAADCWNKVAESSAAIGINTVLHIDALSALRSVAELATFLNLTSRQLGLALDTAELAIAGFDTFDLCRRFHDRVRHFHFKNALATDSLQEFKLANAERALLQAGGSRKVPRWFGELEHPDGLVDFPGLLALMRELEYSGWVIVESDKGPLPAAAAMMSNGWYVQHVLRRA